VFGDGKQTRDFTFIENVVQANMLALDAPTGPAIGMAFNVGTGVETEINRLLELILQELGKKVKPRYEPARADDIRNSLADITLARRFLGYKPEVTLEEGVARTVRYCLEHEE
jgi:nucleoside-diphosphate-sugar epimerase